ncbi:putative short chain type dehydrogenase [Biscogniauxia mediterranea]|nr:putative short chain type dehydrogenase [Biscogniauxia mediterranea]
MATALIIGAGPRVGQATAEAFAAAGYKVAVASRTSKLGPKYQHFVFDAYKPETVPALFEKVSAEVGVPSVVIYNAYGVRAGNKTDPFDSDLDQFRETLNPNVTSPYVTAREAVKGFEKLSDAGELGPAGGTFIFTGNLLNESAVPTLLTFGIGKTAAAHLVKHLALAAYEGKPYKFYYGDERHADGTPMIGDLSGKAHADQYLELAKDAAQRPWQQTFVAGKGYVKFEAKEFRTL